MRESVVQVLTLLPFVLLLGQQVCLWTVPFVCLLYNSTMMKETSVAGVKTSAVLVTLENPL
jgi:hypothetical protein